MRKVVFRADASAQIGYGHKTRCHALAAILAEDFECSFPCEEGLDGEDFIGALRGDEIVVLDNYFYDEDYESAILEKGCRLVRLNDFEGVRSKAEVLINPSWGMGWSLLREPFVSERPKTERDIDFIVCFGGVDPLGLTDKYVNYLRRTVPGCRVETFSGLDAESLAALMRRTKAAVCSASTVCREALACGCKVFAGWYVDNQVDSYRYLCEEGLITPLGDLREPEISFNPLGGKSFSLDFSLNSRRYHNIFKALDYKIVRYQDMTPEESREAWKARIHPETRRWMTNSEAFSFESHCSFVEKLRCDTSKMYLGFFKEGQFFGSYDIVGIDGGCGEHGLFVAPGTDRKGIGSMMEDYADSLAQRKGIRKLRAEVFKENVRSVNYHKKVGYMEVDQDERYIYFERKV